jgi:hypothetical protein
MNQNYLDTARLLTQVAPLVFSDGAFALKGGTAINLFIRDMPRLSVDLDLVFSDHRLARDEALARINASIRHSAERLEYSGVPDPCARDSRCRGNQADGAARGHRGKDRSQLCDARHRPPYTSRCLDAHGTEIPCWPISKFRWCRWRMSTAANSSLLWTASTLAICST